MYQPADTREAYVDSCASFKPQKVDIALGISEMEASLVKSVDKITTDSAFLIQVGSLLGSSNSLFSINHNDWSLASGLANLSRAKVRSLLMRENRIFDDIVSRPDLTLTNRCSVPRSSLSFISPSPPRSQRFSWTISLRSLFTSTTLSIVFGDIARPQRLKMSSKSFQRTFEGCYSASALVRPR